MEVEKGEMEKGTAINDWGQKEDGSDGENNKREDVNPPFPPVENLKCAMKLISCLDVAKSRLLRLHEPQQATLSDTATIKKPFHALDGEVGVQMGRGGRAAGNKRHSL